MPTFNLCFELVRSMEKMGFDIAHVNSIKNDKRFGESYNSNPKIQRTALTMVLYDLIMYTGKSVPVNVRVALNAAPEPMDWFQDIVTGVLPFIRENSEEFFKRVH